jgi:tRNA pseudouridine38-40 synthase
VYLDIEANAFLHHMVRNIAGALMAVGRGEKEPHWLQDILDKRDRTQGGVTAPPAGLYLVGVRYPERYAITAPGDVPGFG